MKATKVKFASIVRTAAMLLAGSAAAEEGGKAISSTSTTKTHISLGTATPGGGFPLYGNALAEVMNAADPELAIEPRNTKGSNENIPLLEAGQLDIALVAGEPAYAAFSGIGRDKSNVKILTAIYSSPGMFVVRADSPYKTIRDLVGQPIAFGAKGSGLPIMSRYVLDGRAAALWGAGIGWPGFDAVAKSPAGARFIAPDAKELTQIRAKHSFLKALTIPANSYPGQTAPIDSVGSWSYILVRNSLSDDVAYHLARTLHSVEGDLCKKLPQACETTAANTVAAAPDIALIHPGVMKYLKEIGAAK